MRTTTKGLYGDRAKISLSPSINWPATRGFRPSFSSRYSTGFARPASSRRAGARVEAFTLPGNPLTSPSSMYSRRPGNPSLSHPAPNSAQEPGKPAPTATAAKPAVSGQRSRRICADAPSPDPWPTSSTGRIRLEFPEPGIKPHSESTKRSSSSRVVRSMSP